MQFVTRQRKMATINIISLVDVVFLLLIFFTVTATFMDQPALKLDLPEASAEPQPSESPQGLTVYLTEDGQLFFGDQPIRAEDLKELIGESLGRGDESRLTIKADRGVIHGRVVEVMDIAHRSGIKVVTIGTRTPEKKASP
ncbi:MAG: biopolymer transporter ExbD [Candidatus Glassbacteria bacterium]|nr:biopolymer transporter ExbD [Candidatus Glassbacteria bacterium]